MALSRNVNRCGRHQLVGYTLTASGKIAATLCVKYPYILWRETWLPWSTQSQLSYGHMFSGTFATRGM